MVEPKRGRGRPKKIRVPGPSNIEQMRALGWKRIGRGVRWISWKILGDCGGPYYKGRRVKYWCDILAEVLSYNFANGPIFRSGYSEFCQTTNKFHVHRSWNRLLSVVREWGIPHERPVDRATGQIGLLLLTDAEAISEMAEWRRWKPLPSW